METAIIHKTDMDHNKNSVGATSLKVKVQEYSGLLTTNVPKLAFQSIAVRNKQELMELIQSVARDIIRFDNLSVFLVDDDGSSHISYFYYSREAKKVDDEFMRIKNASFPVNDGFFDVTMENDFPIIWDLQEVSKWKKVPERVLNCMSQGVTTIVGVAIADGDRKIGNIFWGYKDAGVITENEIEMVRQVGAYVGQAIVNINSIERNLKRLKEKELMLGVSNLLFAARDKTALIHALNAGLKTLLSFNGLMIILNESQEHALNPYVLYFDENKAVIPEDKPFDPRDFKSDLKLLKNVFSSNEAAVWLMNDLMKLPARPDFITRYRINNVKKVMGIPLSDKGSIKGALFLFADKADTFGHNEIKLLNDFAATIAKSVTHIRFLEELAIKDQERDIFLATTRALTAVSNGEQVRQALQGVFANVGFFNEGFIHFFSTSNDSRPQIIFKQTSPLILSDPGLPEGELTAISDHFLMAMRQIKQPFIIDIAAYFYGAALPPYVSHWKANDIRSIAVAPFIDNGLVQGLFFLLSTEPAASLNGRFGLISDVVGQIAAAVNHSLANERLSKKLSEINQFSDQLEIQNSYLQQEIRTTHNYSEIIGASDKMREVFHMVSQVARTNSSVLIMGETGTGKELIARAIHNTSQRKDRIMIKVNCGALPPNLIESELFGHERGSFTGAIERRIGKFELANNSTIFLDEIGELPMLLQVKLLRALQEGEIERLGGKSTIKIDVRVIAASNRDLLKEVHQGNFRPDLYFRLNVFPIDLPALRDRKEDIPILANHFAEKYAKRLTGNNVHFTSKVLKQMIAYNWPGNVRELEHLVERSILLAKGKTVSQVHLPVTSLEGDELPLSNADVKTLSEIEREHIISVLKMVNGKISGIGGAAEMLKIPATTLASKIIKLKIKKDVA